MGSHRPERVSERIQHEMSLIFARQVSDPRLENLNGTRVQVTGDLRLAKIYVAPREEPEATRETMAALARAAGFFRKLLSQNLDLRFAPEIRFEVDYSIVKGEQFLKVLEQVEAEERAAEASQRKTTRKRK
ncbi:MAG TPA: 30S ribosome-binding factor RbfA [Anaerolineae bacterium]